MKSYSTRLERIALRSMCSKDPAIAGYVLSHLSPNYFWAEESNEAFDRIVAFIEANGHSPAYTLICEDPKLSVDTREYLSESSGVCKTIEEARQLCDKLNEYRKARSLAKNAKHTLDALTKDSVNLDDLIERHNKTIIEVQTSKSIEDAIYHVGTKSNTLDRVKEILYGEDNTTHIPTGFKTFDDVNIGMPRGGLFMLGGSTGAGKSHMAVQLAFNVARAGFRVVVVPLEMSYEEMQIRLMANAAKTDSLRIQRKDLTKDERDLVLRRWKRADKEIATNRGRLSIYKPPGDVTHTELTSAISSYKPDVVIVDYVGLLSGADGDDQWKALGRISRYFKNWADQHHAVSVLCAQVDAEGKLRYSRTMGEHATMFWYFVADKESKEQGHMNISQGKGRMMKQFDFTLKIDYATSRITDMPSSEVTDEKSTKGKTRTKEEGSSKDKYMPDLSEEI